MEISEADRSQLSEGRYANYFEIGHNAFEFLLDLGQLGLETEPAHIYLRVITSPSGARKLCQLLNDALAEYYRSFGAIRHEDE
ncbi:MAG TPA: DUF3467 domain-containing protein [Blastocatellia bacterium]|nr:DUF3467 domain-containing protein [Blastocatellia bacterium]